MFLSHPSSEVHGADLEYDRLEPIIDGKVDVVLRGSFELRKSQLRLREKN